MISDEKSPLGRLHAIWTLQGLDSWDKKSAEIALRDHDWQVQLTAIRASENIIQSDIEKSLLPNFCSSQHYLSLFYLIRFTLYRTIYTHKKYLVLDSRVIKNASNGEITVTSKKLLSAEKNRFGIRCCKITQTIVH